MRSLKVGLSFQSMKARPPILLWLFVIFIGVLASSWWISKHPSNAAQIEEPKSPDTIIFEPKTITIFVGGEVESPQAIQVPRGTTLLEALNIAGGRRPWGTARYTRYFIGKDMWNYNIETAGHLILHDHSTVVVPSKSYWEEWAPKYYPIFGNKTISLTELQATLAREVKGNWIPNFWDGMKGIELRVPRQEGGYACFIRLPTDQEITRHQSSAPPGDNLVFSILIRPANTKNFSKTTEKIRHIIQTLISD